MQRPGGRRDPGITGVAPPGHLLTDAVDQLVEPDLIGGEFGEFQLTSALAGSGHRHEVRRRAPRLLDPVGDALIVEREVPARLVIGAVQDRVVDHFVRHRRHPLPLATP